MSKPLSAPEISSHPDSVRSFGAVGHSNHVPGTTSEAKPKAITAAAFVQCDGADAALQPIAENLHLRNGHSHTLGSNGVLDDCEGSDPNTPRLPPTGLGNTDLEIIPHEAAVSLDLPDQPLKSSLSSQTEPKEYPYPSFNAATGLFSSSLPEPSIQTPNKPPVIDRPALVSSNSHQRAHIKSWLERSQKAYTLPPAIKTTPLPYIPRTESQEIASNRGMSGSWGQEGPQMSIGLGRERPLAMGAREEAFSEKKRNRSSSRSSQSRVEKRIEATMADAEPPLHARSRKSSHVLGLFKENKSSRDTRKAQERQRTTSDNSIDAPSNRIATRADEAVRSGHERRPSLTGTRDEDENLGTIEEPLPLRPRTTSADNLKRSRSDTDLTIDDLRPTIINGQEKPEGEPVHNIPPRLLEEIRDYHNLTTPFHDKFRSTQSKSAGIDLGSKIKQATKRHQISKEEDSNKADPPKSTEEPENEEEESEHISSALYYPHQAPSPDALEDISIVDARKRKDAPPETLPDLPDPALSVTSEDEKVEDVDIALQVHNKNRYLHGDLQKARQSSGEQDTDGHSETGLSSASDSEYESLDETKGSTLQDDSSLTDDAEATPRASPKTRQSYLLSRSRKAHRGPKAPLGAVELKPYNHQVGGHTTVFRFSKRAVCKQLTNRENEFYEVIERQQPDLLSFLPR